MGSSKHHPKRGSMGFSPRKRARKEVPHIRTWPEGGDEPKIQGFAGYKAGMTHVIMNDDRAKTTTAGQEISVPVTVVEVPPLKVAAVRFYRSSPYGLKTVTEIWSKSQEKEFISRFLVKSRVLRNDEKKWSNKSEADQWKELDRTKILHVAVLVHTQPVLVSGLPKKKPELMEFRIGGGAVEERIEYGKGLLGKDVTVGDIFRPGQFLDVMGITRGRGFQGPVQRWGVKKLTHKNSKHRRLAGTLGPWHPAWVMRQVPQPGQMGYHHRTEYNKRLLQIGEKGAEVTPAGGFLHYGEVKNPYVLIRGSLPGPAKRLLRFREPTRAKKELGEPDISYVSIRSKQGV